MPVSQCKIFALPYTLCPLWRAVVTALAAFSAAPSYSGGIDTLYPNDPFSVYNLTKDSRANYTSMPCETGASNKAMGLSDIVDHALCRNPQTRQAWMTTRLRAAELGVSKGAYLPAITVVADVGRTVSDNSEINIGQTVQQRYNQYSVGVNVSYVLLDFGVRSANVDSAKEILTAANATMDETIQTVYLSAAQAYYDLFAAQATLASTQQAEYYASEAVIAAEARHASGLAALNDILQAKTQYSQAKLNRQSAESKVKVQQGTLAVTMGLPMSTPVQLNAPDLSYKTEASDQSTMKTTAVDTGSNAKKISASPVVLQQRNEVDLKREKNTSAIAEGVVDPRNLRVSYNVAPLPNKPIRPSSGGLNKDDAAPALAFVQSLGMLSRKHFLAPNESMKDAIFVPDVSARTRVAEQAASSTPTTLSYQTSAVLPTSEVKTDQVVVQEKQEPAWLKKPTSRPVPAMADPKKIDSAAVGNDVSELLSKAELERPVLQAARAQTRSAEAKLRAIDASGWPTLVLTMGATDLRRKVTEPSADPVTGETMTTTSVLGGAEKTIGFSIQFPIFDRFNRQYNRQAAESQLEIARIEEERLANQIKLEVWKAYQENLLQVQSIQSTEDLLVSAQHNYKMSEGRYKAGVGSMLELMNAQVGLRNAEQQHIQALYNWQMARLKLAQSIGRLGLDKV